MLNMPETHKTALLHAVNVRANYEEDFDSFKSNSDAIHQLFGKFAVTKISQNWMALMFTITSVHLKIGPKDTQQIKNISDLIAYDGSGNATLTMKAQEYLEKFYVNEAQVAFDKKCRFLLSKQEENKERREL